MYLSNGNLPLIAQETVAPGPGVKFSRTGAAIGDYTRAQVVLTSVVLNVATTDSQRGNSFFGLGIGFTVMAGGYTVGHISGGVFNPAVGTGLLSVASMYGTSGINNLWIYWIGPFLGGVIAAITFRLTNPKEYDAKTRASSVYMPIDMNSPTIDAIDTEHESQRASDEGVPTPGPSSFKRSMLIVPPSKRCTEHGTDDGRGRAEASDTSNKKRLRIH